MKQIQNYSIGIIFSVALFMFGMLYNPQLSAVITGSSSFSKDSFLISRIVIWAVLFITIIYSKLIEKERFLLWNDASYPFGKSILMAISVYFIAVFGAGILGFLIEKLTHENNSARLMSMRNIFKDQYFLIFFTCITAAVVEELFFRGYLQTRLEKIYKNPTIAIIFSAAIFGILHSTYGTWAQVVGPFFIGIVFSFFYKKYKNLKILIIVHFLIDVMSLMAMNFSQIKH